MRAIIDTDQIESILQSEYIPNVYQKNQNSYHQFEDNHTIRQLRNENACNISHFIHRILKESDQLEANLLESKKYIESVLNNYRSVENNLMEQNNSFSFDSEVTLNSLIAMEKISTFDRMFERTDQKVKIEFIPEFKRLQIDLSRKENVFVNSSINYQNFHYADQKTETFQITESLNYSNTKGCESSSTFIQTNTSSFRKGLGIKGDM